MADLSLTAANVLRSSSGQVITGTAGATITAGKTLYLDGTTNTLKLCDSNAAAPANTFTGIALNGAGPGQPVSYCPFDSGGFAIGATVAIGDEFYASNTPGGITSTKSDLVSGSTFIFLGTATSTTLINFTPVIGGVLP